MSEQYEAGEIIEVMCKSLERQLEPRANEVHKKTGWQRFWLIHSMREDLCNPKVIREGWVACPTRPINIDGCLIFYIDFPKGILECERALPRNLQQYSLLLPNGAEAEMGLRRKI